MSSVVVGAKKKSPASQHGGGVRGDSLDRRSSSFEGRFGRMFRSLPPAEWPKQALVDLGQAMTAEPERVGKLPSASPEGPKKRIQDDEENAGIPAGYTYLGQFIDHDITFDPSSSIWISIRSTDAARQISPTCTRRTAESSGWAASFRRMASLRTLAICRGSLTRVTRHQPGGR